MLAQPPKLVLAIKLALDALLDSRLHRPLLVFGRIVVDAAVSATAEVRVIEHIRRDDPADTLLVVGDQPDRQYSHGRTTVGVLRDFRHGKERKRGITVLFRQIRRGGPGGHETGDGA